MAGRISNSIVTNGLVMHLDAANRRSYPGSGTAWRDLTANKNDGTLINSPVFSSANGGSIVFDGTNDYIDLPSAASSINSLNVSVGCWINQNSIHTSNDFTSIIMVAQLSVGAPGSTSTFYLHLRNSGVIWRYQTSAGGGAPHNISPPATQEAGVWCYYVGVSSSTSISLYKNGSLVGSVLNGVSYAPLTNNNINLARNAFDNTFFNGSISNVKIYNRALSAQEVLQNYNALKSRYGLP